MSDTNMRDPLTSERQGDAGGRSAFQFEGGAGNESLAGLVHQLAEQGSHLAQQQLRLVEAEVRSGVADVKESAGAMAGAAVLGLAGLGVLLMGIAYLLAEAMPLWLAATIVGAATLVGAYAMLAAGRKKLQSSSLGVDRTRRTLERAPTAMSGNSQKDSNDGR